MRQQITAEDFVRAWQTSATVEEVSRKLDITVGGARVRATDLRNRGIPLKIMPGGRRKIDIAALAKLANDLAKTEK